MVTRKKPHAALETFMRTLLSEFKATLKASAALPMLVTQPEAAAQLSIGMTKLNQLIKSGQLRTVTLGKGRRGKRAHPMVPRAELERLCAVGGPAPTPPPPAKRPRASRPPRALLPAGSTKPTREAVEAMILRNRVERKR